MGRRPQSRCFYVKRRKLALSLPGCQCLVCLVNRRTRGIQDAKSDFQWISQRSGVVEPGLDRDLRWLFCFQGRLDQYPLERNRGKIGEIHIAVESTIAIEIAQAGWDHLQ